MIRDLGGETKQVIAIAPISTTAATLTGVAIDRRGYQDVVFSFQRGEDSGTPDDFLMTGKIQESDASGSGFTDITGAAITSLTQDSEVNAISNLRVNLRSTKRYIRAISAISFTAGSSPELAVAVLCTLGSADVIPAV
jgi:hypothetical protein